jgi:signal transduction histidine kinase
LAKKERIVLREQLAELQGDDLRRLGLDLHSSIVQSLAALTANLDVIKNGGHTFDLRTRNVLDESSSMARECFQQLLALAELLCPAVVDEIGPPLAAELGSSSQSRSTETC